MILAGDTLPDNVGYVAAAYLVFLLLLLIYVAIMAAKLARLDRGLTELNELADRDADDDEGGASAPARHPEGVA